MSSSMKGMIGGFIATLVLSGLMIVNNQFGFAPQIDIIRFLTSLGTLTVPSAWMDHFIVGVVVWGLLFTGFDATMTRSAYWMKGLAFGVFAWVMMMITFMPVAGAGFFGSKLEPSTVLGLLALHLIYGVVLGVAYGLLGQYVPVKAVVIRPQPVLGVAGADGVMISGDINDHLESSNPSGRSVLIFFGSLIAIAVLLTLVMKFRLTFGF